MKLKLLTLGLMSASVVLTGCGGSDSSDPTPSTTPTPTTTPITTTNCASDLPSFVNCTEGETPIYTLVGQVDADYTMSSDWTWWMDGVVTVGAGNVEIANNDQMTAIQDAGVTLTIEAGTHVRGTDDAVLLVTRGSQLIADGTATDPITFSSLDEGYDGEGEWGGIVIQGFAPQYGTGNTGVCYTEGENFCNIEGEGGSEIAFYGGNVTDDNSGVIRYVRIAEGGLIVAGADNNEVNGLTLQGVGHATTVEYVHVHNNLDDGIEWFGGTVNARHVVLTNNDDDDIDFDEGFQGNIQYAIIVKNQTKTAASGENDPRGIEANSSDAKYVPQTEAVLANVTIIGGPVNNAAGNTQPGMRLRGSVNVQVHNSAVRGFDTGCIRIDDTELDSASEGPEDTSTVALNNVIADCEDGIYDKRDADTVTNVTSAAVTLDNAFALTTVGAELDSTATINAVNNGSGFTFDSTDYIGAVAPGTAASAAWWAGWTLPGVFDDVELIEAPAAASFVTCEDPATVCTISGTIDSDYTIDAIREWRLDNVVTVGAGNVEIADNDEMAAIQAAGVTLTIEAGADIKGFDDGVLLVTRGSKLMAEGTAEAPITFSSLDADYDGEGEWGGIVIQGFAPQYGTGNTGICNQDGENFCNVEGEGGSDIAYYGGTVTDDNSGVIRYVRIAEGGLIVAGADNNEVNGLTLQGVGHGTTVEYVHVHNNLDDGIEWFGGTVNARYVVLTNNDDDDIDFDEGFQGNIQFAIIVKNQNKTAASGENDPRGIEANSSDAKYVPQTQASLANITLIGGPVNNADGNTQPGMRLRGSVNVDIFNTVVNGFDTGCIRIDDSELDANSDGPEDTSTVNLTNVFGDCTDGFYDKRDADSATNSGVLAFNLDDAFALSASGSLDGAATITEVDNGSGFEFIDTSYIGAVAPGTAADDAWWAGWTIEGALDDAIANNAPAM